MVRRSLRRKLQKFTRLCGREEGLRVRGVGGAKGRTRRWQQEMEGGLLWSWWTQAQGRPMDLEREMGGFEGTEP